MTDEEILQRIGKLSGASTSSLINFCKLNMITYTDLNSYYMVYKKLPSVTDCAILRSKSLINLQ